MQIEKPRNRENILSSLGTLYTSERYPFGLFIGMGAGAVFMLSEEEFANIITKINIGHLAIILLIGIGAYAVVAVKTSKKMYA